MGLFSSSFTSLSVLLACTLAQAETSIQSGPARAHLLELYTSEGCSSCPPAERWLSDLRSNSRLWKDLVPVSFHVDYWDDLGWKDRLASPAYSARQRNYAASWGTDTVYTPGFVLDGREWRDRDLSKFAPADAGILRAVLREKGEVEVSFRPGAKLSGTFQVHVALLGFGMSSDVKAGENRGRKLDHDFAVLDLETTTLAAPENKATLRLPAEKITPGKSAFAVWVTETGKTEPVQAAGGPL